MNNNNNNRKFDFRNGDIVRFFKTIGEVVEVRNDGLMVKINEDMYGINLDLLVGPVNPNVCEKVGGELWKKHINSN